RIETAVVAHVLTCHSFPNRLTTFETARRIEIGALLAGVEVKCALGALSHFGERVEHGAALGATRHGSICSHLEWAWTKRVIRAGRLFSRALLGLVFAVHVTGLPVFSVRHDESPPTIVAPLLGRPQVR